MKKVLSAILVVFFIVSSFSEALSDTENIFFVKPEINAPTGGFLPDDFSDLETLKQPDMGRKSASTSKSDQNIYDYLEGKLRAKEPEIDIYSKEKIGLSDFHKILRTVLFNNYDIMVYDKLAGTQVEEDGKTYVYYFRPKYFTPAEGEEEAQEMMKAEISKYLDAAKNIPNDDVIGKMLVIYDLFCKNNVYAKEAYYDEVNNGKSHNETRLAYWVFKYNTAFCQGNCIALKAIYDALNDQLKEATNTKEDIIETSFCSSDSLKHIWNVVKVGGKWYYIDETWDNAEYEISEEEILTGCYHGYFMVPLSDMGGHLKDNPKNWGYYCDETIECDDDRYTGGYIFNGDCYTYFEKDGKNMSANCGSYFGTVSYENGRYKIEVLGKCKYDADNEKTYFCASSEEELAVTEPFWSKTVKSPGFIATDVYDTVYKGSLCKAVCLFANKRIENGVRGYYVRYGENGIEYLKSNKIISGSQSGNKTVLPYSSNIKGRLFYWSEGGFEPLCRAIDIP